MASWLDVPNPPPPGNMISGGLRTAVAPALLLVHLGNRDEDDFKTMVQTGTHLGNRDEDDRDPRDDEDGGVHHKQQGNPQQEPDVRLWARLQEKQRKFIQINPTI